ncbi:MAG: response regulator transcription factor [Chlorobi bacterium]|nr:response regulator transcription factor [Chlorobiota bacterium]
MENSKTKILLVEDDANLGTLLSEYLKAKNFIAELYTDGKRGYEAFMKNEYDICVLDIMMPIKDGFTLAQEIRLINSEIPIIFLTAKTLKEDILKGFEIGADDYITKPFSMEELLYRIEAILRRANKGEGGIIPDKIELGKYVFEPNKQLLKLNEQEIKLTTKESELLRLLCKNKNQVLERNFALKTIWDDDTYFNARSMDVYITKLRKHLKEDTSIEIINVHGKGFKLIV